MLVTQPAGAADAQQCANGATDCPLITHVEVSRSAVTVAGTALVPVTYTVGLTSRWSYGIPSGPIEDSPYRVPLLLFGWADRSWPGPALNAVALHLVSGTAMEGDWRATIYVPSTVDGTMVPSAVSFISNDDPGRAGDYSIVPDSMRVPTAVGGSHAPKLTVGFHRASASSKTVVVTGQALDRATGKPIPNVSVRISTGQPYCLLPLPALRGVTNANGAYAIGVADSAYYVCVGIAGPRNSDGLNSVVLAIHLANFVRPVVGLGPATSSISRGDSVTLSGTAALGGKPLGNTSYGTRAHVLLQRWINHGWQTVSDGHTRASGRFDLVATPSAAGTWSYRAILPGTVPDYWTGASRAVTVQVR